MKGTRCPFHLLARDENYALPRELSKGHIFFILIMRTIHFLSLLTALLLLVACTEKNKPPQDKPTAPTITPAAYLLYENFPSKIIAPRNVEIWLPEEYDQTESLPVLYMFDGQNIFHGTRGWSGEYNRGWEVDKTLDSLIKAKVIPPIMVVGIFNAQEKRGAEYMPAKPKDLLLRRIEETQNEWYRSFKKTPPESDEQLRFVVEELKPFIDTHYKNQKRSEKYFGWWLKHGRFNFSLCHLRISRSVWRGRLFFHPLGSVRRLFF